MIFPTNPTINQIYSENNKNWIWTGISWIDYNPAISQLTILKGLLSGGNASGAGGKLIVDDVASTTNETCNSLIVGDALQLFSGFEHTYPSVPNYSGIRANPADGCLFVSARSGALYLNKYSGNGIVFGGGNGVDAAYINSTGSLGIGTNSPRGKLEMSSATSPSFALTDTSQTSNNKTWDFESNNGQINFRAVNDDYSTANVWLSASRTGTTITNVTFPFGISTYSSIVQDYGSTNAKLSIRGALGNTDYSPLTQAGDIGFIIDGANAGRTDAGLTFAWWNSTSQGMRLSSAGNLTISGNSLSINTTFTPSASASTGVKGQITWDTGYIYVCTATNTWKRAALSTW